jgi:uncharacterized protein (TIGR02147 family)
MHLGSEAIDRFSKEIRNISAVTIGVSAATFEKVCELLIETRGKIIEMANSDPEADRVYQVGLQVFPLSRSVKRKKGAE